MKGHYKKHNDKKFKCTKCDFKCASANTLNNHTRAHTGEEICISPLENDIKSSQASKRDREKSISPNKTSVDNNVIKTV